MELIGEHQIRIKADESTSELPPEWEWIETTTYQEQAEGYRTFVRGLRLCQPKK